MRSIHLFACLCLTIFCQAQQKIAFVGTNFKDSSSYAQGIEALSKTVIPIYTNADRTAYLNDLFRVQFAAKQYATALSTLDSCAILTTQEPLFRKVFAFHYRSFAMASLQTNTSFQAAFQKVFNQLYTALPEEAQAELNNIYNAAYANESKEKFKDLTAKYIRNNDSITVTEAIQYIRLWNTWQIYTNTSHLAKQAITAFEQLEKTNKEEKLLGLNEGFPVDSNATTYITHITLVDVEQQKLIPNATVGIVGKKIASISTKATVAIPKHAVVIDGSGKFLMPGMTDAHIHFFQSGGLYTRPDGIDLRKYKPYEKEIEWSHLNMKDVLKRNIANGITTVVDVGATYRLLELRDAYKGKTFAPNVWMAGPLLTTSEPEVFKNLGKNEPFSLVTTPEEGRKMVQQQLPYKPDLIKIWYILEEGKDKEASAKKYLPIIQAIIAESHQHQLKVAIHAMESITAQLAVDNGCDYLVHNIEDAIITKAFAAKLKEKQVVLCPTMTVYNNYGKTFGQLHNFSNYTLKHANPEQLGSLFDLKHLPEQTLINAYKNNIRANKAANEKQDSLCLANLKTLVDAGVRIAAGTDAGNIGTLHGTALYEELLTMQKSGMSHWQILQSATINPSYILGKEKEMGSIAIGKIADLVLLKGNPIDSLSSLRAIDLVINKGKVIQPDTLIKETALALVQRQLNAYNARNLDAFLEPYAEDVELYQFPDKLLSKGKEAMRKDYAFFKDFPELHCEIKERIIQGNIIIDKESVTGFGGAKPLEATAIYYIENNKIKKVYFIQ